MSGKTIRQLEESLISNSNDEFIIENTEGTRRIKQDIIKKEILKDINIEINTVNSQLEQKASKTEVNSKIWGMANMGQDVKTAMTGGSVAVVGKDTVLTENIVDGQVTAPKISDSLLTKYYNMLETWKTSADNFGLTNVNIISTTDGLKFAVNINSTQTYGNVRCYDQNVKLNNNAYYYRHILVKVDALTNVNGFGINLKVGNTGVFETGYTEYTNVKVGDILRLDNVLVSNSELLSGFSTLIGISRFKNNGASVTSGSITITVIDMAMINIDALPIKNVETIKQLYSDNCLSFFNYSAIALNSFTSDKLNSYFSTKKWVSYGDSITAQGRWQGQVINYFKIPGHTNCGIGGTTVSTFGGVTNPFCSSDRILALPTDARLITVMGGTNDWSKNCPIGDLSYPFDKNTFKGGLASTIEQLLNKYTSSRCDVIIMSPVGGRGLVTGQNMTEQVRNTLNLTTEDYAIACKEVAHYFSLPFIDVFGESEINQFNRIKYIEDLVHPNWDGGQKISRVVVNGLKKIEPLNDLY